VGSYFIDVGAAAESVGGIESTDSNNEKLLKGHHVTEGLYMPSDAPGPSKTTCEEDEKMLESASNMSVDYDSSDFELDLFHFTSSDSDKSQSLDSDDSLVDTSSSDSDVDPDDLPIDSELLKHPMNMTEKEYQSVTLLECFLRNQFSASASKDTINTLKETFPKVKEITDLDWDMLSHIDQTPLKEIHYCDVCTKTFPDNKDIFYC
jgi:hypothetical protein